jgi:hypothetical protein
VLGKQANKEDSPQRYEDTEKKAKKEVMVAQDGDCFISSRTNWTCRIAGLPCRLLVRECYLSAAKQSIFSSSLSSSLSSP